MGVHFGHNLKPAQLTERSRLNINNAGVIGTNTSAILKNTAQKPPRPGYPLQDTTHDHRDLVLAVEAHFSTRDVI